MPDFYAKRNDGRDEPIVEPELAIIDTHHHLADRPGLHYMLDDLRTDLDAGHRIIATVYIENLTMARPDGPELLRPLGEVEFANGMGAMGATGLYGPTRFCAAISGHAQLSEGDGIAALLDRYLTAAPDRLRTVRQMTFYNPSEILKAIMPVLFAEGILASDAFKAGYRHLASRGLAFEATVFHNQLNEVSALADMQPDTPVILTHLGLAFAMGLDAAARAEVFTQWRGALAEVARRSNVLCKIGGLGMPFWGFGLESRPEPATGADLAELWRPYIDVAIELFGPERCMMESDFPEEGMTCGYVPIWNALKLATAAYSADERRALFHDTAARTYRISTEAP